MHIYTYLNKLFDNFLFLFLSNNYLFTLYYFLLLFLLLFILLLLRMNFLYVSYEIYFYSIMFQYFERKISQFSFQLRVNNFITIATAIVVQSKLFHNALVIVQYNIYVSNNYKSLIIFLQSRLNLTHLYSLVIDIEQSYAIDHEDNTRLM